MAHFTEYYWIVICKNRRFHYRQNLFSGHRILLGVTDAYLPPPRLEGPIRVKCDDCGETCSYTSRDVLRCETAAPASFTEHPQFSDTSPNFDRKIS